MTIGPHIAGFEEYGLTVDSSTSNNPQLLVPNRSDKQASTYPKLIRAPQSHLDKGTKQTHDAQSVPVQYCPSPQLAAAPNGSHNPEDPMLHPGMQVRDAVAEEHVSDPSGHAVRCQ